MPTSVAVVFHNQAAVFFAGQTISGYVQVICDKPKSCRGKFLFLSVKVRTILYINAEGCGFL